jgi:hypothetical protein
MLDSIKAPAGQATRRDGISGPPSNSYTSSKFAIHSRSRSSRTVARRRALTRRFSAKATIWRQMTSSPTQVPVLAYGTGTANRFRPRFRRCDGPPKVRP